MGLKTYGAIGAVALGALAVSEGDKAVNYVETTAKITKSAQNVQFQNVKVS